MDKDIYFDYAATTPVDPAVLEVMIPYFSEKFGNPSSSTHSYGWRAKEAVNNSLRLIAENIGAESREVVFTSGATESINIALKGVFDRYQTNGNHIISCKTEHKSTLDTLEYLAQKGARITYLPVDKDGRISLKSLEDAICDDTILICIMWVNNETGVIQNIKQIGAIANKFKVLFLCDATQAIGKTDIDVNENNISLLALSAHKIYGPKGIGALYISRKNPRVSLATFIHGGSQENSLRAGTLNTPAIVAFGKAITLLGNKQEIKTIKLLSNQIVNFLIGQGGVINGSSTCPHIINVHFSGSNAVSLLKANKQFCFSLGSACSSENLEPSHVLRAMDLTVKAVKSSFRISIGRMTTADEVNRFIKEFKLNA
jgi:cysteine desulfurase